jgi:hypothetical protein
VAGRAPVISTRIGDCGPKGKGVFTMEPISASTRVATYAGTPKWIWDIPQEVWPYAFQVDYDQYVLPRRNSVGWFINHSCEPNCLVSGRSIVAKRRIREDEELTFDYSTDVDWPGFRMICRCGSAGCRRMIRAYRFLPRKLKLGYGRCVAPYILKRYGPAAEPST